MYDYQLQCAAVPILVIILIMFYKNKKLPLLTTRIFSAFLVLASFNLICDFVCLVCLDNFWSTPVFLTRMFHQLYIGSLDALIFMIFLYINTLSNRQKRASPGGLMLMCLPLVLMIALVIIAPIDYNIEYSGGYVSGPMVLTVFMSLAIYIIWAAYNILRIRKSISRNQRILIFFALGTIVFVALIQYFNPAMQVASQGVMLVALFIYLSFENPREFVDAETRTLDNAAYRMTAEEMYAAHRKFYIVNYTIEDVKYIQNTFGHSGVGSILAELASRIKLLTSARIFRSKSNILTVITQSKRVVDILTADAANNIIAWHNDTGVAYKPIFRTDIIECPKYAENTEKLYDLTDYLRTDFAHTAAVTVVDHLIIDDYRRYAKICKIVEHAVHNNGFDVHYQPIYSNETNTFASAEALVRLKNTAELGFVSPEVFIPIAEQRGYIKELGAIVFEKVCSFISSNNLESYGVNYVEINLSRVQGVDGNLVRSLTECMDRYGINPKSINLEITETASVESSNMLINNMNSLREYGCHFSMDDFGTGYSNLSQIAKVKYELIKLDKSLIWACFEEEGKEQARIILNNCVDMLRKLGVKIVAEGVETEEQAQMLTEMGVTYLQGFRFSKPITEAEYLEFLSKGNKPQAL